MSKLKARPGRIDHQIFGDCFGVTVISKSRFFCNFTPTVLPKV